MNQWASAYSNSTMYDQHSNEYQIDDEGRFATTSAPPPPPGPSPSLLYSSPNRYNLFSQQKRAEMSMYTPTKRQSEIPQQPTVEMKHTEILEQSTHKPLRADDDDGEQVDTIQLHNWYIGLQSTSQATTYHKEAEGLNEWIQVFGIRYKGDRKGKSKANDQGEIWHSSLILERVSSKLVKSKSGKVYELKGLFDSETCMNKKKISSNTIQRFQNGFPTDWKDLVLEEAILRKNRKEKKRAQSRQPARSISVEKPDQEENNERSKDTKQLSQVGPVKSRKQLPKSPPHTNTKKKRKRNGLFRYDDSEGDESEYNPTSDEDVASMSMEKSNRRTQPDDEEDDNLDGVENDSEGRDSDDGDYVEPQEKEKKAIRRSRKSDQGKIDDGMVILIDSSPKTKAPSKKAAKPIPRELRNLSKTAFGNLTLVQNAIMEQLEENRSERRKSGRHSMPSLTTKIVQQPFTPQSQIGRKIMTPRSSRRLRTPVRPWWEVGPQEKKKRPEIETKQVETSLNLNMNCSDDLEDLSNDSVFTPFRGGKKNNVINANKSSTRSRPVKRPGSDFVKSSEKRQKKQDIDTRADEADVETNDDLTLQKDNGNIVQDISQSADQGVIEKEVDVLEKNVVADDLQYIDDEMHDMFVDAVGDENNVEEQAEVNASVSNVDTSNTEVDQSEVVDIQTEESISTPIDEVNPIQRQPHLSKEMNDKESEEMQDPSEDIFIESASTSVDPTTDVSEWTIHDKDQSSKETSVDLSGESEEIFEKLDMPEEDDVVVHAKEEASSNQPNQEEMSLNLSSDTQVTIGRGVELNTKDVSELQTNSLNVPKLEDSTQPLDKADVEQSSVKVHNSIEGQGEDVIESDGSTDTYSKQVPAEQKEEVEEIGLDIDGDEEVEALIVVADDEEKNMISDHLQAEEEIGVEQWEIEQVMGSEAVVVQHLGETQVKEGPDIQTVPPSGRPLERDWVDKSSPTRSEEVKVEHSDPITIDVEEGDYPILSINEEHEVSAEFEAMGITSTAVEKETEAQKFKVQELAEAHITTQNGNNYLGELNSALENVAMLGKEGKMMMQRTPLSPAEDSQMDDESCSDNDDGQSDLAPEDVYYFSD